MIRVALVDDQELLRTGFRMVIQAQPDMAVVAEAGDGVEALAVLAATEADVVLMDVRMPRLDGLEATRQLLGRPVNQEKPLRVLILTTFDVDEHAYAALQAGASGFLLKDAPSAELLYAIRAVASGDAIVAPSTTRRLLERFGPQLIVQPPNPASQQALSALTERERAVLTLLARGLSNAEIAQELVVAEATAKTHVHRILTKLNLRDRVQAVILAYESGVVRAGSAPDQ